MEYYPRLDEHIRKPIFKRVEARYKFTYDVFKPLLALIERYHQEASRERCYTRPQDTMQPYSM